MTDPTKQSSPVSLGMIEEFACGQSSPEAPEMVEQRSPSGDRRHKFRPLADRLHSMTREQLIEHAMASWAGAGWVQAKFYAEMKTLEMRIYEQRNTINKLISQKTEMHNRVLEAERQLERAVKALAEMTP